MGLPIKIRMKKDLYEAFQDTDEYRRENRVRDIINNTLDEYRDELLSCIAYDDKNKAKIVKAIANGDVAGLQSISFEGEGDI